MTDVALTYERCSDERTGEHNGFVRAIVFYGDVKTNHWGICDILKGKHVIDLECGIRERAEEGQYENVNLGLWYEFTTKEQPDCINIFEAAEAAMV
jgi:hypothetical protein